MSELRQVSDIALRPQSEIEAIFTAYPELQQRLRGVTAGLTAGSAQQVLVWIAGADGMCTSFNEAWLEFTGRTLEMELGDGWIRGVHPDDLARFLDSHVAADKREPFQIEYRLRRKDGEYRWLLDSGAPLYAPDGRFGGFVGACVDITERKLAEQALQESEAKFRLLFDATGDALCLVDDGRIVDCNTSALRLFGCGREQLIGQSPLRFMPERQGNGSASHYLALEAFSRALSGQPQSVEWQHCRIDGGVFDAEAALNRFELQGRLLIGFRIRDVTERKAVQNRLLMAAEVLNHAPQGIVITDSKGEIVEVNPAFLEISGYARQDVLARSIGLLHSGHHDSTFYETLWNSVRDTGRWQGEIWDKRKNGEVFPAWLSIIAVKDGGGAVTNYLGFYTDVTARKQSEEHLHFLANHDALTELPNRTLFNERLVHALCQAQRYNKSNAVLFIDLDRFKVINDTLGHQAGDSLLQHTARRLLSCLRESDTVARVGGDEFTVLIEDFPDLQTLVGMVRKLLTSLSAPFSLDGREMYITASVGISTYPADGSDAPTLLKKADIAMYRAKDAGRNNYQFYSERINVHTLARLELENSLRRAVQRQEFSLQFQPKLDLFSGGVNGVEALVRWHHPELGVVPPGDFIPLAEETGLIVPIGEWVLRTACAQNRAWQDAGLPPLRIAVNLSARQFRQENLLAMVWRVLEETRMEAQWLELEITESMVMQNVDETGQILQQLKTMGVHIAIDDFGTGYSSLSYLKRFPIHTLKIDRSFVQDLPDDVDDAVLTRAMIAMAHMLKLRLVAEGVETKAQLDFLREHLCDEMQGYYFSTPLSAEDLEQLLRNRPDPVQPE
ncbi:MAG: bifunctional diguanylate cyclase/phosphodiesterase [Burkholderiales bacterium]